jgi:hypothetical protein
MLVCNTMLVTVGLLPRFMAIWRSSSGLGTCCLSCVYEHHTV